MKTTLCMALVVNAAFYVVQQLCRIYFGVLYPLVSFDSPQQPDWFSSYALGFVVVGFGLLLWTACLPAGRGLLARFAHIVLIVMAALNLAYAVTVYGFMTEAESDLADNPTIQALRAKHARRYQPKDFGNR